MTFAPEGMEVLDSQVLVPKEDVIVLVHNVRVHKPLGKPPTNHEAMSITYHTFQHPDVTGAKIAVHREIHMHSNSKELSLKVLGYGRPVCTKGRSDLSCQ